MTGRGQTPHHEFWLDPNDPENPACRVCDKPASHTWHSPAWCSARKTLSGFRAGACIYAAGHAGDHKWADAESFSGRRPSAPPTDDASRQAEPPPTHEGPCTRSVDPDGKPLRYCAECFQDVP